MSKFNQFGNDLYTGKRSIPFVFGRRAWYTLSAVLLLIALVGLGVRGLNLGLEFTGGSEFRVSSLTDTSNYEDRADEAVNSVSSGLDPSITRVGGDSVRIQTEELTDQESAEVRSALVEEFGIGADQVSATFIGPSWGETVSQDALRALVVYLVLTAIVMAVYFRTWKMAVAAFVALGHDLVFTVGIYALSGFEVSPATMIGFLTVLGYSLYDTVVVFDKVRENTTEAFENRRMTYAEAANLAVNQTVVRSINTTVVALLPIAAVLVIGFTLLGPGTLLDLSLVLFIGMAVGAYSSIFIATPLLVSLRSTEPEVEKLAKHVAKKRSASGGERTTPEGGATAVEPQAGGREPAAVGAADRVETHSGGEAADGEVGTLTGRRVHKYAQAGPRNQPKRETRSRRSGRT